MDMEWIKIPGYVRAEACVAGSYLFVRDPDTRKLIPGGTDGSGARTRFLQHESGAHFVLTEDEIRDLLGVTEEVTVEAQDPDGRVEVSEDTTPEEVTDSSPDVGKLKAKIDQIRQAAANAHVSQAELSTILGVSKYWVKKALGS